MKRDNEKINKENKIFKYFNEPKFTADELLLVFFVMFITINICNILFNLTNNLDLLNNIQFVTIIFIIYLIIRYYYKK